VTRGEAKKVREGTGCFTVMRVSIHCLPPSSLSLFRSWLVGHALFCLPEFPFGADVIKTVLTSRKYGVATVW
jgi:hypothetical protein